MPLRNWLVLLVCLVHAASPAGQEVTVTARVDSTDFLIGDAIRVSTMFRHPPGISFTPVMGDTIGGFTVLQRPVLTGTSDTTTSGYFVVSRYDSGSVLLPPVRFAYGAQGDTLRDTVKTAPLALTLHLAAVDTSKPIRDLKPPIDIPMSAEEIALIAGVLLLVLAAAYIVYRLWKKRREKPVHAETVVARKPAHVLAFEELGRLKEERLWQRGRIKDFYSELTEILRRYFENRYQVSALEQTTDQIVANLRASVIQSGTLADVERVLSKADLVKFAKLSPSTGEHEEAFSAAYEIVEKTKVPEAMHVTTGRKEVPENAGV